MYFVLIDVGYGGTAWSTLCGHMVLYLETQQTKSKVSPLMHAQTQADSQRFVGCRTDWEHEVEISHAPLRKAFAPRETIHQFPSVRFRAYRSRLTMLDLAGRDKGNIQHCLIILTCLG